MSSPIGVKRFRRGTTNTVPTCSYARRMSVPVNERRGARIGVATAFAAHAVVSVSWAPRIPAIKAHVGLSDGQLGIALTGFACGTLLGTQLVRRPVERFGSRAVIRVCVPLFAAALVGPGIAGSLAWLTAALAVLGLFAGALDVAMNVQAVDVERVYARPMMSGIHAAWSVGMLVGGGMSALAAALGVPVAATLIAIWVVVAVPTVVPLSKLLPADVVGRPDHDAHDRSGMLWPIAILGAIGFGSFLAEGSAADWSAVYLHEGIGVEQGTAALAFVAFSVGMATTRSIGDRFTARFGPTAVVRVGGIGAAIALASVLALHATVPALTGFGLLGLCLGPVVPVAFSAAGNAAVPRPQSVLGWVVTISYLGSITGPILIGAAAEAVSLRAALIIPVGITLVIALIAGAIPRVPRT
jgi:MFS family permease